ncbi:MAG: hypothetical protein M3Y86_09330 [Verrucomicrobiota bacterium]|nr:hypothetical protein [Verrucomicrobiota bacterium]
MPAPDGSAENVLQLTIDDGVFWLSQQLNLPSQVRRVSITFSAQATDASETQPVQVRVRFYNKSGDSDIVGGKLIRRSNEWETVTLTNLDLPASLRDSVMIESNRGQGALLIKDVTLTAGERR